MDFVDLFNSLHWTVRYPARILAFFGGGYVSNHPELFPPWAVALGGLIAGWVVLAFLWQALNAWRVHNKRPRLFLEPSYIIILGLVIALAGALWQTLRPPKDDPRVAQLQSQITALQNAAKKPAQLLPSEKPTASATPEETPYTKGEAEKFVQELRPLADAYDSASDTVASVIERLKYFSLPQAQMPVIGSGLLSNPAARRAAVLQLLDARDVELERLKTTLAALAKLAGKKPKEIAAFFEPVQSTADVERSVANYKDVIRSQKEQATVEMTYRPAIAAPNELLSQYIVPFKQQIDLRRKEIESEIVRMRKYAR